MMPILTDRRPPSRAMTMGHCAYRSDRSTDDPVVTKNRPSSSDRNGRMSASTCETSAKCCGLMATNAVGNRLRLYLLHLAIACHGLFQPSA